MKTKRNRWLFGIALVGGALALLFLHYFLQPVPTYGGKDANFWFDAQARRYNLGPASPLPGDPGEAFRNMGPDAVPFLVKRLQQAESWERWYLMHWGTWPAWIRRIVPVPRDWNARSQSAVVLLLQLGPAATNAVPELIPLYSKLRARDAKNSTTAMITTARTGSVIGTGTFRVIYSDMGICKQLLNILGSAGKGNREALNTLAGALQEREMADTAIQAMAKLGKQDENVVPRLVEELNSTNNLARSSAAEVLGLIGSPAHLAITGLKERAEEGKEADRQVRFKAAEALWKIDRQAYAIVPFRIEELNSPNEGVKWNAAGFLAEYGMQSKPAVPALMEALKDKNNRVRGKAAMALGQIGPAAKDAAPALKEASNDEYSNVREAAEEALKKIESAEVP